MVTHTHTQREREAKRENKESDRVRGSERETDRPEQKTHNRQPDDGWAEQVDGDNDGVVHTDTKKVADAELD